MKIEDLSMLARLHLTQDEKDLFSRQVGSIIDYIDQLNELDTASVKPTAHILPINNVFREDSPRDSLPRDKALRNAPETDQGFYKVPKIIE